MTGGADASLAVENFGIAALACFFDRVSDFALTMLHIAPGRKICKERSFLV
jgi:hypothetical protein